MTNTGNSSLPRTLMLGPLGVSDPSVDFAGKEVVDDEGEEEDDAEADVDVDIEEEEDVISSL